MSKMTEINPEALSSNIHGDNTNIDIDTGLGTIVNMMVTPIENKKTLVAGTKLLDKYIIERPLNNKSGEAKLYICSSTEDSNKYVAKVYNREVAVKKDVSDALKKIKSPYIATLYDTGELDGFPFEILPYFKNGSIESNRYSLEELTKVVIPSINEALHVLHEINIIHKDLKPSNIMELDDKSGVALIDFGISSMIGEGNTLLVTRTGMTPEYSAPETFRAVYLEESDYYSFGITLYELFFGYTPYKNMTPEEITQYMAVQHIPFPDDTPDSFRNLLLGLTYNDLTNRNNLDNPNRRWTYAEVLNWCKGIEQIIPGTGVGGQPGRYIPQYTFGGKQFTDINKLADALACNWEHGKRQLYRGILSEFFKGVNPEIANYCMDAEESLQQGLNEDVIFFRLLHKLNPDMQEFYWLGQSYNGIEDFGQEMLHLLRSNDSTKLKFWDSIILNRIASSHLTYIKADQNLIQLVKSLELHYKTNTNTMYKKVIAFYTMGYLLTEDRNYMINGIQFDSLESLIEYLQKILESSFESFRITCSKMIIPGDMLDAQLEAWLSVIGCSDALNKWKQIHRLVERQGV